MYKCSYNICKQNIRPEQCHPCMFKRARGAKLLKETSLTDSWHSLQRADTVVTQVKTSLLWSSSALSWCYTCEHQNEKKMAWLLFWLCERRIWYMEVLVGHMTHIYWSPGSDKKNLKSIFQQILWHVSIVQQSSDTPAVSICGFVSISQVSTRIVLLDASSRSSFWYHQPVQPTRTAFLTLRYQKSVESQYHVGAITPPLTVTILVRAFIQVDMR